MSDEAIPAATLIVVREVADGPPQLLMVERAEGMAFAAGALVFPGGRIDEADCKLAEQLQAEAAAVAAIRETVEETAVPVGLTPTPGSELARELQRARVADQPFGDLLSAHALELDVTALTPFAWAGAGGWSLWRKLRFTATVVVFSAFGLLLAVLGALQPWNP